jgi:hypothetical protein
MLRSGMSMPYGPNEDLTCDFCKFRVGDTDRYMFTGPIDIHRRFIPTICIDCVKECMSLAAYRDGELAGKPEVYRTMAPAMQRLSNGQYSVTHVLYESEPAAREALGVCFIRWLGGTSYQVDIPPV